MQKNIFPEDFFCTPNQYKTIQNPINKNREHPKIINPTLLKSKSNQPLIAEIKEEKCEESIDVPKNKKAFSASMPFCTKLFSIYQRSYNKIRSS